MSKILIIGYGNCLRQDDGLGWIVAEKLQERLHHPDLTICAVPQLYPEMAALLSGYDHAIFIDASAEGIPGQMTSCYLSPDAIPPAIMGHFFDPRQFLATALALYAHAPDACIYTVTGASFDYGTDLSPTIQDILPVLVQEIERLYHHLSED